MICKCNCWLCGLVCAALIGIAGYAYQISGSVDGIFGFLKVEQTDDNAQVIGQTSVQASAKSSPSADCCATTAGASKDATCCSQSDGKSTCDGACCQDEKDGGICQNVVQAKLILMQSEAFANKVKRAKAIDAVAAANDVIKAEPGSNENLLRVLVPCESQTDAKTITAALNEIGVTAMSASEDVRQKEIGICNSQAQCTTTSLPTSTKLMPVETLTDSLDPVKEAFNAAADKPRVVALFSPTCGGCVYGAEAVKKQMLEELPDQDFEVFIVWVPMLPSDDEDKAKNISGLFDDSRVKQFYDPNRVSGKSYSREIMPTFVEDVLTSLPDDHFLTSRLQKARDRKPEEIPSWDVAFFYEPGTKWNDTIPEPASWSKQIMIQVDGSGKKVGTFLVQDGKKQLTESDWHDEIHRLASQIINR